MYEIRYVQNATEGGIPIDDDEALELSSIEILLELDMFWKNKKIQ
jgi:hypothetical protein